MKYVLIIIVCLLLIGCNTKPVNNIEVKECLQSDSVIMYGTEWCSFCNKQKQELGEKFNLINFVDCDKNRNLCEKVGVKGFPTWSIDGKLYAGYKSLNELYKIKGCD